MKLLLTMMIFTTIVSKATWNELQFTDIVTLVNSNPRATWTAGLSKDFPYDDDKKLHSLLGLKRRPEEVVPPQSRRLQAPPAPSNVPNTYDLRDAHKQCPSIGLIRNQGGCGSCWAVAGANVITDAFCIQSSLKGKPLTRHFSFQDPLENCLLQDCGAGPNDGCNGGFVDGVFKMARRSGIVTGSGPEDLRLCKPYILSDISPPPNDKCDPRAPKALVYARNKQKVKGHVRIVPSGGKTVSMVAMETMMKLGPLIAAFDVFKDFMTYLKGVYYRTSTAESNTYYGGHAVRVIGWGFENNVPFWLIANTWGSNWGDKGYVKIKRGVNEVGIEDWMFAVTAI